MTNSPLETFVRALEAHNRKPRLKPDGSGTALCPAHDDKNPSLSFRAADDGTLLAKCHAGDSFEAVLASVGMDMKDAFPAHKRNGNVSEIIRIVWEYVYRDRDGGVLATKRKFSNGSYMWLRDGSPGLSGLKLTMYNLHLLAQRPDDVVFIVEGEKDCDTLTARGFLAVCSPNGADDAKREEWLNEIRSVLRGRDVVVLCDNDSSGFEYQKRIASALYGVSNSVRLVPPFPHVGEKGDVTDWLQQQLLGGVAIADAIEILDSMFRRAADFNPEVEPTWSLSKSSDRSDKTLHQLEDHEQWSEPVPLDAFDLPQWHSNLIPEPVGTLVSELAINTETPIELASLTALAVVSTTIQGKYSLHVEGDYQEELALWILVALPPAERKTVVLNGLIYPLDMWQEDQADKLQSGIKRLTSLRATAEASIRKNRQHVATIKDPEKRKMVAEEIADEEANLPEIPRLPRLTTCDFTPEKLGPLMAENHERMAVFSDEAGVFSNLAGRYDKGRVNLDLVNKAYYGSSYQSDRISRDHVQLRHPVLSIGLTVQPDALLSMPEKDRFRGQGLLGRFLLAVPVPKVGSRKHDVSNGIPESVRSRYTAALLTLLDDEGDLDKNGRYRKRQLTLSSDAHAVWKQFQRELEPRMAEGSELENMRDWGGKLPGTVARIAAIFHAIRNSSSTPLPPVIQEADMQAAVCMGQLLIPHAQKAFDLMHADPVREDARRLHDWIMRNRVTSFTVRDAQRSNSNHFKRVKDVQRALELLDEYGYTQKLGPVESGPSGGRPTVLYQTNPLILPSE